VHQEMPPFDDGKPRPSGMQSGAQKRGPSAICAAD
jgi:hypothetical protein